MWIDGEWSGNIKLVAAPIVHRQNINISLGVFGEGAWLIESNFGDALSNTSILEKTGDLLLSFNENNDYISFHSAGGLYSKI